MTEFMLLQSDSSVAQLDGIKPNHESGSFQKRGHKMRMLSPEEAEKLAKDLVLVSDFKQQKLEKEAQRNWDLFYKRNSTNFFKDRHWTTREFEELRACREFEDQKLTILEAGCGVGNCLFPLLEEDLNIFAYACDFSPRAVEYVKVYTFSPVFLDPLNIVIVEVCRLRLKPLFCFMNDIICLVKSVTPQQIFHFREKKMSLGDDDTDKISSIYYNNLQQNPLYDTQRCKVFQCDLTKDDLLENVPPDSVDVVTLIFVLSAIHPEKMHLVLRNIYKVLKPGKCVLFRDYGLYDHAMLRFKSANKLSENFYVRQDGTRSYFFSDDFLAELFLSVGYEQVVNEYVLRETVNKKEGLSVPRVFLQSKFLKPQRET